MELFKIFGTLAIDGVDKAKKGLSDVSGSAKASSSGIASSLKKIGGAVATYFAVDKIKDFGLACINAAADANAANAQFSSVFGELEAQAKSSLTGIANETGVTETRMKASYTKIAAFAKTTGMDTAGALELSNRAMMAVADSAAFYDRTLEETTESLQSFLKGNFANDAALGLSCTETTRNAAANKLYGKSFADLSESQKQLTLLQMVEDANKTSGALGQAARESDTWSNQLGNLKQSWTDFMAVVGQPILDIAVGVVKTAATAVSNLTQKFTEGANPVQFLIDKFTTFKTWMGDIASYAMSAFQPAFDNLKNTFTTVKDALQPFIDKIVDYVTNGDLAKITTEAVKGSIDNLGTAFEATTSAIDSVVNGFKGVVEWGQQHPGIIAAISGAVGTLTTAIIANNVATAIQDAGGIARVAWMASMRLQFAMSTASLYAHTAATWIATTATTAFGAAMAFVTSPITLIVAAIAAVIAIGVLLYKNWDTIKEKAAELWSSITEKFGEIKTAAAEKFGEMKTAVVEKFNEIKTAAAEKLSGMWETISTFFSELPGKISEWLSNTIESITTWAGNIKDKAVEAGKNFLDGMITFFTELPGKIGSFLYNASVVIAGTLIALPILAYRCGAEFVTKLVQFVIELPGKIKTILANTIDFVKRWATDMANKAKEVGTKFITAIVTFFTQLPGKIQTFLTNTINKVKTWATNMANKGKEAGTKFVNTIVTFFTQLPGKVWTFLSNVISKVTTWATNMASKAKAAATQFITNAANTIASLPGKIWTFLSNVISKVAEWGSQMMAKGKEAATKLVETVSTTIKELPGKVADVGKNLVEGIWKGISGSYTWITTKIKQWCGDVTSFVKKILGIHSPSTEWRDEIGVWLAKGLAEGITDGTSDVEKAAASLGEAAATSASDALNYLWGTGWQTKPLDELLKTYKVNDLTELTRTLGPDMYLRALVDTDYQATMLRGAYGFGRVGHVSSVDVSDYTKENGQVLRNLNFWLDGKKVGNHSFILGDNPYVNDLDEIAVAAKKTTSVVKTETSEQGQTIKEAAEKRLNDYTVYNKMTLSEEVAYWNEVRKMAAEGTDERIELDKKYFEVKQDLDDQMLAAEKELQSTLSDIYGKVADRKQSILDSYGLFGDGDTTTDDFYFRLYGQVKGLEQYQKDIDALEARIGGTGLYEAIKDMGLDAHEELVKINGMTDDALQNYVDLYDKRSELAGKLAHDELKDTIATETEAAYKQFATTVSELGGEVNINTTSVFESMRKKAVEAGEAIGACEQHMRNMFDVYSDDLAAMFGDDSALATVSDPSVTLAVANNHSNEADKELPKEQKEFNTSIMDRIRNMDANLKAGFAQLEKAFDVKIVLDSGVLVGSIASDMNMELGKIAIRKDRGR